MRHAIFLFLLAFEMAWFSPAHGVASPAPLGTASAVATRQEVWQTVVAELRGQGLAEKQMPRLEDLDLPGVLPGLVGRELRVTSACWDQGPRRMQFRLECGEAGACLPFLVYLRNDGRNADRDEIGAIAALGARAKSCRGVAPLQQTGPSASMLTARPLLTPPPTIRPGEPATAVFVTDHFRMSASVTCLDRGRAGDVIRVRSLNGQIFRARISGPALLDALPE